MADKPSIWSIQFKMATTTQTANTNMAVAQSVLQKQVAVVAVEANPLFRI